MRHDYENDAIFFHDELRAGTRSELSRKWAPMGHRPVAPIKIGYENTYRTGDPALSDTLPFYRQRIWCIFT
ncbi:hypothetical protein [Runella sp.]|uniref:hypothetical protein n=1 Tax=Runella sp. TaxID=1960881 RepID=UPI0026073F8C|nr:hypothetical protein [Runella sp.]